MDASTAISLVGNFSKVIGNTVADLKSREVAEINIELLDLKQSELSDQFEKFKNDLDEAITNKKTHAKQDHISRGLGNSTVLTSALRSIDQDAEKELERASSEYKRAIEEIALMKRRHKVQTRPWWRRLLGIKPGSTEMG